jgi:signal transduction histidine kinase/CheY-like chemotaxis protein
MTEDAINVESRHTGRMLAAQELQRQRRVEAALREETRALEILNRTGAAIAAELDLRSLVQTVTDAATQLSGAEFGAFFYNRTDEHGDAYQLYTLSGAARESFERLGHPRATPIFSPTFDGDTVVRSDDITEDPRYGQWPPHYGMPKGHLRVRSYLAVPVVSRSGEVLGGLFFGHPDTGVFTERNERIVVGIAAQAAISIDNARLFEAAQKEISMRERAEQALKEADRRKDEFLATLAHELRNPLAPMRQAAMIAKRPNATREQVCWSRDVVERQVEHMALLLDDLLDICRITSGQLALRKERAALAAIVDAALETAGPALEERKHRLSVELPGKPQYLDADPMRVAQVVSNLLTNAAKYTAPGGDVRLSAFSEGGELVIRVADSGIGIDREALPRIFDMFSQPKAALDRAEGGLGVGLALVKGLVKLHGGRVEAASGGSGHGSEFTVRLPLGGAAVESAGADSSPGASASEAAPGRSILVADDNRDTADSLGALLRLHGHSVTVVYDGDAALSAFSSLEPQVAILDIGMPNRNGYEVAREIRSTERGARAILVALTGWGQDSDKERAAEAGFDHHFTKPTDIERLTALL